MMLKYLFIIKLFFITVYEEQYTLSSIFKIFIPLHLFIEDKSFSDNNFYSGKFVINIYQALTIYMTIAYTFKKKLLELDNTSFSQINRIHGHLFQLNI